MNEVGLNEQKVPEELTMISGPNYRTMSLKRKPTPESGDLKIKYSAQIIICFCAFIYVSIFQFYNIFIF